MISDLLNYTRATLEEKEMRSCPLGDYCKVQVRNDKGSNKSRAVRMEIKA